MNGTSTLEPVGTEKPTTAAPSALPCVKELTREQRTALMLDLVKAWFDDVGVPAPFVVREGEKVLGVFKPEFHFPKSTTIPDFPPEFIEEMKRRQKSIDDGTAKLLTTEEALDYIDSEFGQTRSG